MRTLVYKLIYQPGINRVLRTFNRWLSPIIGFRLLPSGVLDLRLKSGTAFKLSCNPTSHVAKVLYYGSPDAFEYTSIFEHLILRCHSFADVGANAGYYSILAAKLNPAIKVYAFEPAPGPLYFLRKNVAINGLESNVETAALALHSSSGTLNFQPAFSPKYAYLEHHLGGTGHAVAGASSTKVPSETLDRFLGERLIDLIKLDTEGNEDQILAGAESVIKTHRPIIICETLFNKIEPELESTMIAHGYEFYNHRNGRLIKVETLKRTVDDGIRDCFFVPREKFSWIEEFI